MTLLNKVGEELQAEPSVKVHKVTLTGAVLRVDVKLKNPTNGSMRLVKPFVTLSLLDGGGVTQIGTSDATGEMIDVPRNGEVDTPPIWISLSFLSLIGPAFQIVKDLFLNWGTGNHQAVSIRADIKTRVNNVLDVARSKVVPLL